MAENGGMACKCAGRNNIFSFTEFLCVDLDHHRRRRSRKFLKKNLTNVVSLLPFLGTRCLSLARNNPIRSFILSMDSRENFKSTALKSSKRRRVPIFVMMPVDSFGIGTSGSPRIRKIKALNISMKALKLAGVHGIAVEVWWGIIERFSPTEYNWSLYEQLFKLISEAGLKLHVVLSFHANKHSASKEKSAVSLPLWILEIGEHNKDIFYRDRYGFTHDDYLTLGVDQIPLFCGRTALQCYEDFMFGFVNHFESYIGSEIEEISIGLGPSGELRYPAHPSGDGRWRFPGIGEFQCYDKYMMEDLRMAAHRVGKPHWGETGPQNAGAYNSFPAGVPFFEEGEESFLSDYGRFFLEWYSGKLIGHADAILAKAANILRKYQQNGQDSVLLVAKIGGIYWWYRTVSHPAELTAGYYNTSLRDGYDPVASVLSRHGAALHVSCFEMMDAETPQEYQCSPEGLLQQIWTVSKERIVHLTGSNTSELFDKEGWRQIHANCYYPQAEAVRSFTYFRMNDKIFRVENWSNFVPFVKTMMSTATDTEKNV